MEYEELTALQFSYLDLCPISLLAREKPGKPAVGECPVEV
jgi:hypothetical protein